MSTIYDLAIVGGGASGLAAAVSASESGEHVLLLESSSTLGRKILASGNGRCNLMNRGQPRYYGESVFAEEVIRLCGWKKLITFWHYLGVIITEDEDQRCYPATFQASTVVKAFKAYIKEKGVDVRLNTACTGIVKCNVFKIITPGLDYYAKRVLVSAGGAANQKLGGSGSGYELLQSMGHTIQPVQPALVPVIAEKRSISGLSGIRVRCMLTLFDHKHLRLHRETGEVLFTDYGVSGICVMQCARFIEGEGCYFELDLGLRFFEENEKLEKELQFRRIRFRNGTPDMLLNGILPDKLSFAVMKQAGLDMRGETISDLEDEDISRIIHVFHHYRIPVIGPIGLEDAQVTAGGMKCSEFQARNMESRILPGLYAAGEILNIDGDCGGFNLMFAFSSGILAGSNGHLNWLDKMDMEVPVIEKR